MYNRLIILMLPFSNCPKTQLYVFSVTQTSFKTSSCYWKYKDISFNSHALKVVNVLMTQTNNWTLASKGKEWSLISNVLYRTLWRFFLPLLYELITHKEKIVIWNILIESACGYHISLGNDLREFFQICSALGQKYVCQ